MTFEEIEVFTTDCLFDKNEVVCSYDLALDELVTVVCEIRGAQLIGMVH